MVFHEDHRFPPTDPLPFLVAGRLRAGRPYPRETLSIDLGLGLALGVGLGFALGLGLGVVVGLVYGLALGLGLGL